MGLSETGDSIPLSAVRNAFLRFLAQKPIEDYRAEVADLKDHVAELEEENEPLQGQLDQIADIAAGESEKKEEEEEEDDEAGEDDQE